MILKVGYSLMIGAGLLLLGYGAYGLGKLLWRLPGVPPFLRWVALLGAAGFILTLVGLIWERFKEVRGAGDDH
ncbi:MAG TPA: hypothetical protein ENI38_03825 [Candidatus Acetothermia bacterium]|nr:hypothetical protein [Candidatus Acetothermia bacterium]